MATRRISTLVLARIAGGVSLLVVGGIHLEQYTVGHFSVVPTIGTLFLVNFVAATVLGLWLLVPVRGGYRPPRLAADCAVSVAGIGVAGGALIALLISEARPLFGFMEQGYRIEIVIALVSEAAAIIFLGGFLVLAWARARGLRNVAGGRGPAGASV
jgi:hypothetical protein